MRHVVLFYTSATEVSLLSTLFHVRGKSILFLEVCILYGYYSKKSYLHDEHSTLLCLCPATCLPQNTAQALEYVLFGSESAAGSDILILLFRRYTCRHATNSQF